MDEDAQIAALEANLAQRPLTGGEVGVLKREIFVTHYLEHTQEHPYVDPSVPVR